MSEEAVVLAVILIGAAIWGRRRALRLRLSNALSTTPPAPVMTEEIRNKLSALYHQIQNGDIPIVPVPIALQRNENCHYFSRARWYESRVQTMRIDYAGVTSRIQIMKGMHFRMGSIIPRAVKQDVTVLLDAGTLYLTNKRVIFDGEKNNKTIKLTNLIGFEPFADGIGLEKATGKNPIIQLEGNAELAAVVLSELLARA